MVEAPEVSQSTVLLAAVLTAFALWLALNGRLNVYWLLLTGQKAPAGSPGAAAPAYPSALVPPVTPDTPAPSSGIGGLLSSLFGGPISSAAGTLASQAGPLLLGAGL